MTDEAVTTETATQTPTQSSWHEALPNDLRGNESLSTIPDVQTLAKSYLDAQRHIGGSIRIPSNEAGDDDWAAFNKKLQDKVPGLVNLPADQAEAKKALLTRLGVPDTPEGYESFESASENKRKFLQWAHEKGLTEDQAKAVAEIEQRRLQSRDAAKKKEMAEANELLKKEWGLSFEQRVASAKKAVSAYADQETKQYLVESGLANNPGFIRLMSKIGASLKEERSADMSGRNQFKLSPAEAGARISEIQGNKSHPYHNPRHPQHEESKEQMAKYFAMRFPESA